jgi:hypothetical protein
VTMAKPTTYAKALAEKTRLIEMARVCLIADVTDEEIWAEFRRLAAERGAAAPFDVTKSLNESRRRKPGEVKSA